MSLHQGSLGTIHKDNQGRLYTEENKWDSRYWFETERQAKEFINYIVTADYGYKMGEVYFHSLKPEKVRGEWTVVLGFDPGQARINDIDCGVYGVEYGG